MPKFFFFTLLIVLSIFSACSNVDTEKKVFVQKGAALNGYDPVAYFDEQKPVKGLETLSSEYQGEQYYFSTEAHQKSFEAEPEKYLPEYGGWCAYAISINKKMAPNPETFKISKEGKLYLFYNSWGNNTLNKWNADEEKVRAQADSIWDSLVK